MRTWLTAATLVACLLTPCRSAAQFWDRLTNPRSSFTVTHPPRVVLKGVTKISVLDFTGVGNCGPELTERLTQRLAQLSEFEIIDRASLAAVLSEQDFQASGAVSPDTQVKLGALLGPAAIFTGRVTQCSTNRPQLVYRNVKDRNGGLHREYIARSTAGVTVSISIIDLTTGRRYSGGLISRSDTLANAAVDAQPEYPSVDAVRTKVFEEVTAQAVGMLLPTSERVEVVLYDDGKCGLKESANLIKASDFDGATKALRASVTRKCDRPGDRKLLAKAYYDLGVALTYSDHYDDALTALRESASIRSTGITREAMTAVNRLMSAEAERKRAEENAVELGAPTATASGAEVKTLTNKEILELVGAKLSDAIIIAQIRSSPCHFDTSPTSLIALKKAGASDAVILEMQDAVSKKCR